MNLNGFSDTTFFSVIKPSVLLLAGGLTVKLEVIPAGRNAPNKQTQAERQEVGPAQRGAVNHTDTHTPVWISQFIIPSSQYQANWNAP